LYHRYLHSFPTRRSSDLAFRILHRLFRPPFGGDIPKDYLGPDDLPPRVSHRTLDHLDEDSLAAWRLMLFYGLEDGPRFRDLEVVDRKSTRLNSSHVSISY